jgi:2-oxoglutarate ferredoxin oxidoreductase subunit gamma
LTERIIVTGFGGQGILFLGRLLAQTGMAEGHQVTFFPAYGPEVRGGRANCHVIISSEVIYLPKIAEADAVLAMNQLSWDYFAPRVRPDGVAVLNASMVERGDGPEPERLVAVPATDIAKELGDVRATNMVMLGAYNHSRKLLPPDSLVASLRDTLGPRKAGLFDLNRQAICKGAEAAAAQAGRVV